MSDNTSDPTFWLDYEDEAFDDVYFGYHDQCAVDLKIEPLNSGTKIKIHANYNKDLNESGTFDDSYIELFKKESAGDFGKSIGIWNLGDVPFDQLVGFAVVILKLFAPKLINEEEMQKELGIKKEEENL